MMTSSTDFQHSLSTPKDLISEDTLLVECLDDIVFTQNLEGQFLSFYWKSAHCCGVQAEKVVGSQLGEFLGPVSLTSYLAKIQEVSSSNVAQSFSETFCISGRVQDIDLIVSPVLVPDPLPKMVIVIGRFKPSETQTASPPTRLSEPQTSANLFPSQEKHPETAIQTDYHHKLLTQIAWSIRRTLDLPTIWQQTVQGLGKILGVNRCIVCPYEPTQPTIKIVAEYCRGTLCPMVNIEFAIADDPDVKSALSTLKPINVRNPGHQPLLALPEHPTTLRSLMVHSMLVVTTCYQDQPNGLIVLYQDDQPRRWTEVELGFIQELADQVGTAIAHASLMAASQSLAEKLQRTNSDLLQKQRELEEAREQAEEASRLKSEFLANTSHEVRTPLNGVLGFLKLILDGTVDDAEEQLEFIRDAHQSALHLLSVLDDILDIAKLEAGKLQIEMMPVKLGELLREVETYAIGQIRQKNLSFEIQKPPTDDEIILYGNYKRLVQVMLNLVGNAIKFTHEGGVTISVEIIKKKLSFQDKELPGMAKIRVADTGIGVSLDKQDRLFQSFSQVDGSRTRQYGGTGLGLAISQSLVEAMGGVVNFYSMGEGLGSTVTFTVPLYQEPVMISAQTTDNLDSLL